MSSDASDILIAGPSSGSPARPHRRWLVGTVRVLLPVVVLAAGVLAAARLIATAPQAPQRPPVHHAALVVTRLAERVSTPMPIEAMGRVIAAESIQLAPQVSGEIIEVHPSFELGGRIPAGEVIVRIEPATYRAALAHAEATLIRREAEVASAERELRRLLTLQERQAANTKEIDDARTACDVAKADRAAARATREQATIDLEHTTIRAPFNGIVTSAAVTVGVQVTPQTPLAGFVGTDAYWVQVSVPVDRLRWVKFPAGDATAGSPVRIMQAVGAGEAVEWHGRVLRLLSDLEPQGRMARVLVEAPHPLDTAPAVGSHRPLLIGAYVSVEIKGHTLRDVVALDRRELREGDSVWLMNGEGALEIRPVEVAYRGRERVWIRAGLNPGERIVISDLPAPVAGMPLRAEESADRSTVSTVDVQEQQP